MGPNHPSKLADRVTVTNHDGSTRQPTSDERLVMAFPEWVMPAPIGRRPYRGSRQHMLDLGLITEDTKSETYVVSGNIMPEELLLEPAATVPDRPHAPVYGNRAQRRAAARQRCR